MSGARVFASTVAVLMLAMSWTALIGPSPSVQAYSPAVASDFVLPQSTKTGEGFLRVAMQDDMKTTNTVIAQDVWDWNVLGWLMDGPVNRQKVSKQPFPWMAESWEYDPADPYHAQMTLKKGIFWTDNDFDAYGEDTLYDGDPYAMGETNYAVTPDYHEVTAYDVEFSSELVPIDNNWQNPPEVQVKALDRYTVEYTMSRPFSDPVNEIFAHPIWPEHIWGYHTGDKLTWQPEISEVVYCGMFILDTWDKGNLVKLITNEHYFNKSAIPNIDGIIFKIYGTTDLAILALQSDDVDFIAWAISPPYVPMILENQELRIAQSQEMGFFYLSYNFRNPAFGYDDFASSTREDVGKPLRSAIASCINKQMMVLKLLQGYGTVGDSVVSPANTRYYNASVEKTTFDPQASMDILDAAGYYKVDGWYVSPDGTPIDGPGGDGLIEIIHPQSYYDPVRSEAARAIVDQLNAVGIGAKSVPLDFGTLVNRTNHHEFDMFVLGWSIGGEDAGYLRDFFRSDFNDIVGGYNSPGYRNESYDVIVDAMVQEINVTRRIELAKRAQGIIARDHVYDILYYRDNLEAYRVSNFKAGWWEQTGGIFNQWTLMSLSTLAGPSLDVDFSGPERLNEPSNYTVRVTNSVTGTGIEGASVRLIAMQGGGEFTPATGMTDANGRFCFIFAPDSVATATVEILVVDVKYMFVEKMASLPVIIDIPGSFWLVPSGEITVPTPVDYFSSITMGVPFEIIVNDQDGYPLDGALIEVLATGDGRFDTDAKSTVGGMAEFMFTPSANQTTSQIYFIFANIRYFSPEYGRNYTATEEFTIEVILVREYMRVKVLLSNINPDVDEEVTVTVTVTTTSSTAITGATVSMTSNPTTATFSPASGITDAQGKAVFTFIANESGPHILTVTATGGNYTQNTARVTISVNEKTIPPPPPPCLLVYFEFVPMMALIAALTILMPARQARPPRRK